MQPAPTLNVSDRCEYDQIKIISLTAEIDMEQFGSDV